MGFQFQMKPLFLAIPPILSLLSSAPATTTAQPDSTSTAFKCSAAGASATCQGIVGYVLPNTTTVGALKRQFTVSSLGSILAVNNLPLTTPRNHTIEANQTVRIPFPCLCSNGIGISNKRPNYTVVSGDGLYHIAMDVYGGLVRYKEIATVNGITNPDLIDVGQKLWIPLPCSCDDVDGEKVVHYGHVVQSGSTVEQIAQKFDITRDTLVNLNRLSDPKNLYEGQVLDVPLKVCTSKVSNNSLDYPLLVAKDTYVLTANNCVMCKCSAANNYTLQCQPSELQSKSWSTCPSMQCSGSSNLLLGNTTFSSCSSSSCAYGGYTKDNILTSLDQVSNCPDTAPSTGSLKNQASKTLLQCWIFAFITLSINFLLVHPHHFYEKTITVATHEAIFASMIIWL